mmetsp:Transcript_46739/g.53910  ORF Transcript_46739/g.53910 Transcript_46739/m.53910 type:complete len:420 (-) Transcript_46739:194-1453(-)
MKFSIVAFFFCFLTVMSTATVVHQNRKAKSSVASRVRRSTKLTHTLQDNRCRDEEEVWEAIASWTSCIGTIPILRDAIAIPNNLINCMASYCLTPEGQERETFLNCMAGFAPIAGSFIAVAGCNLFSTEVDPTRVFVVSGDSCWQGANGSNYDARRAVATHYGDSSRWKTDVHDGLCPFNFAKQENRWMEGSVTLSHFNRIDHQEHEPNDYIGHYVCIRSPWLQDNNNAHFAIVYGKSEFSVQFRDYCVKYGLWEFIPSDQSGSLQVTLKAVSFGKFISFSGDSDEITLTDSVETATSLQLAKTEAGRFCISTDSSVSPARYFVPARGFSGGYAESSSSCTADQEWDLIKLNHLCSDFEPVQPEGHQIPWHHRTSTNTCSYYTEDPVRCYEPGATEEQFGKNALQACCACGGGQRLPKE